MKNILKHILLTIFISLIYSCDSPLIKDISEVKAVPKDAILLFEADEIEVAFKSIQENTLWNVIEKEENLKLIVTQLRSLSQFLEKNKVVVDNKKTLISVHKVGIKSFDYLIFFNNEDVNNESIIKFTKYNTNSKQYDNAIIEEYNLPVLSSPLFLSNYKGVLVLSRSQILLEKSIRQLNSKNDLMDNKNFKYLYESINSKEDFNLLINFSELKSLNSYASNKSFTNWTSTFSDWMELDVSPDKDEIFLSGITSTNDSIGDFLGVFKNQKAQKITIDELLPSGTSFATIYGFENFSKYQRSFKEYLKKQGKLNSFESKQQKHKIKQSDLFDSWVDNQIAFASITSKNKAISFNDLVLIKSRDSNLATDALKVISDKSIIDFRGFEIHSIIKENILADYLGSSFKNIKKPHYTNIGNVIVFSDDIKIIRNVINDYLDGRSLMNYKHFKNLKDDLSSKSNILFYYKNPDFTEQLTKIFPDIKNVINENIKELEKYKSGAVQFSFEDKNAFTNILFRKTIEDESEVKPIWELDFDAKLYPEINTLHNHYTNNKEIAIQDINNVLYLISPSGKILWKKKLESKIIGKISQVDLYKNKKLQMVFNTEKYLYVLDRNGNRVKPFPKKLAWKSSAPVAVFDYSNNRNYRFIVPMGKQIRMYNGKGKIVSGFKFKKTVSTINKTPQHFRIKRKDYIVVSTVSGKTYILDRRGSQKIKIKAKHPLGKNKFFLSENSSLSKSRIATTTQKGELLSIFFNSTIDVSQIDNFDIDTFYEKKDNQTISLAKNTIKWSNQNSTEITEIPGSDFSKPQLFEMNGSNYILIGSISLNKIYLYNSDLNIEKGFPVYGQIVGPALDYNRNSIINFPIIVNSEKGNLKMYSIN